MTPPPPGVLSAVCAHLEAGFPEEACGVLLALPDGTWEAVPVPNALAGTPAARVRFAFAPRAWLAVLRDADARGARVGHVFHSHCGFPPRLSAEDRAWAAPDGVPLLPGVGQLVVAVDQARCWAAQLHWWTPDGWHSTDVALPPRAGPASE